MTSRQPVELAVLPLAAADTDYRGPRDEFTRLAADLAGELERWYGPRSRRWPDEPTPGGATMSRTCRSASRSTATS